jgi:hypothetical protein
VLEIALLKPAVAKMIPTDQTLGADFSLSTGSEKQQNYAQKNT